jgi:hypothetical protein
VIDHNASSGRNLLNTEVSICPSFLQVDAVLSQHPPEHVIHFCPSNTPPFDQTRRHPDMAQNFIDGRIPFFGFV